ncbi:MAG: ABC transporter permease subunit [Pirellulales bacterium]|nr:ABC transporter permease subunit [Pirellulales bacterium]
MYFRENPVLQRELLVNLRTNRAFLLLLGYLVLLGAIIYLAWPTGRIDVTDPAPAKALIATFFAGQYLLASLIAPNFAAGSLTGEKERQTYEMLLSSPLRPTAIVLGKLIASLAHVAILIFASLPIVMLCLPLGGTSLYELALAYLVLFLSITTFGMISLAASSYFRRTAASLVVSYLLILPISLLGALVLGFAFLRELSLSAGQLLGMGLWMTFFAGVVCTVLFLLTARRLLHPPDVGSEGHDVIDEEAEREQSVGLVIHRDRFPDYLFAPPKRTDLLADHANPMLDKEMRSELFAQGTLMLRLVIQIGMFLAIPLMGWCLFISPYLAPWYASYIVVFNMLVGPVFAAGAITSERERQTLELLLTTILSPAKILAGKLLAGLRVSTVLTAFVVWPLVLAAAMVPELWANWRALLGYLAIIIVTCLTTATLALFCSVLFRKTSVSLMTCYLVLLALFAAPMALRSLVTAFVDRPGWVDAVEWSGVMSPFAAAFAVPLEASEVWLEQGMKTQAQQRAGNWPLYAGFIGFSLALDAGLLATMSWFFHQRWRVIY